MDHVITIDYGPCQCPQFTCP